MIRTAAAISALLLLVATAAHARHPRNLTPLQNGGSYVLAEDFVATEKAATFTLKAGTYVAAFEDERALYLLGRADCLEMRVVPPKQPERAYTQPFDCGVYFPKVESEQARFFAVRAAHPRRGEFGLIVDAIVAAGAGSFDYPISAKRVVDLRPKLRLVRALVIDDATLVLPERGERVPATRIVIDGDRIRCVGRRTECPEPAGARRLDGHGRFVMPGLFDAHVHTSQRLAAIAPLYLAFGITSVRDVGGFTDFTRSLQEQIRSGTRLGPRIYTAGRPIDGAPSAWPIPGVAREVRTAEEARAAVRASLAEGADFVKLYNALPVELVSAAAQEAHAHGRKVTIDYILRGPDVVDAGVDGVEHVMPPSLAAGALQRYATAGEGAGAPRAAQTLRLMQERGIALTTTLVMLERFAARSLADDQPTYAALPPALRSRSREMLAGVDAQAAAFARAVQGYACAQVKDFAALGGTILAGTDSYFLSSYPGDLHRELELLVACGLTPAQALAAGTSAPARWLGLRDVGVVEPGARADLLVLRADPLADVRATRAIEWVVAGGEAHAPADVLATVDGP